MENTETLGAKASIHLNFTGSIVELGEKLCADLNIPKFYFDTDQEPPYELFGMCETLGFTLWLNKSDLFQNSWFSFEIATTNNVKDIFSNKVSNLSLWFAKYISTKCKIETAYLNNDILTNFKNGIKE